MSQRLRVTIPRAPLLAVLERARDIAHRKSTAPLHATARLQAGADVFSVTAYHPELVYTATMPPTGELGRGAACVNARDLHAAVAELPGDEVTFAHAGNLVEITAGGVRFALVSLDAADFPPVPEVRAMVELAARPLHDLLAIAVVASSNDETRFHMNAVKLERAGDITRAIGTDGHRLIKVEREWPGAPDFGVDVLVQKFGIPHAVKMLAGASLCRFAVRANRLHVQVEHETMALKLVEAQFPPYDAVIPKRGTTRVEVDAAELIAAAKRGAVLGTGTRGILLTISPGKLRVEANDPDRGDLLEELAAEVAGEEIAIGVNPVYLRQAIEGAGPGRVSLELLGKIDPFALRPVGRADYVTVVMPMRV